MLALCKHEILIRPVCLTCSEKGYNACHWCWEKGKWEAGINRMVYAGYKRQLKPGTPGRGAGTPPPPLARTHAETSRHGKLADTYDKSGAPDAGHPKHDTGIKRWCPLAILPLFDLILDICPDMMHIMKGLMGGHWMPLLKGLRSIARLKFKSKKPKRKPTEADGVWRARAAEYKEKLARHMANLQVMHPQGYTIMMLHHVSIMYA